ncbi:hypothetical protein [Nonomuraea sp. NPDC001636]|uniref:hypothetical protein n=1 Tax=Actinomycetes TaxID=1760 RepID=UPI003322B3C0
MDDRETSASQERCSDCGQPAVRDVVDTSAVGSDGHERQRGALICVNKECAMYGRHLNLG